MVIHFELRAYIEGLNFQIYIFTTAMASFRSGHARPVLFGELTV